MKVWPYTLCPAGQTLNVITILYLVLDLKSTVKEVGNRRWMWSGLGQESAGTHEHKRNFIMINWKLHPISYHPSKAAVSVMQWCVCKKQAHVAHGCTCTWTRIGRSCRKKSKGIWRSCWDSFNFKTAKWMS